jgi:hypothetical protein
MLTPKKIVIITSILLTFIALGVSAYLLFPDKFSQKTVTNGPKRIPFQEKPISPDWLTYTDIQHAWSIQYPPEYSLLTSEENVVLGRTINWYYLLPDQISNCNGLCANATFRKEYHLGNTPATKIMGSMTNVESELPQNYICYLAKSPIENYLYICLWELPLDMSEEQLNNLGNRSPSPIPTSSEIMFDQIVSTLTFLHQ